MIFQEAYDSLNQSLFFYLLSLLCLKNNVRVYPDYVMWSLVFHVVEHGRTLLKSYYNKYECSDKSDT